MTVQVALLERSTLKASKVAAPVEQTFSDGFNLGQFVENFEVIASAGPDLGRLRSLVVELAVRGRLSTREDQDESIEVLLERVGREVGARGAKYGPVGHDETPFPIPSHWRWVRWGHLALGTSSGWSPQCESRPRGDDEWGVLKVSAVSWNTFRSDENKALPKGIAPRPEFSVRTGDFLMSRANTAELVGRSVIVGDAPERLLLSDKIIRCEFSDSVEKHFVGLCNLSVAARAHYVTHASGTSDSMKNISRDVILSMPVPLPPLAEQKRIVAKVDQLMALCDELEARQTRKRETGTRLTKSALEALISAEGPEEFDAAWKRVVENFDVLIDRANGVNLLREVILRLGCSGRLVGRVIREGDANSVLASLRNTTVHSVRRGVPDRVEVPPVVAAWRLPPHWVAVSIAELLRVGELVDLKDGNHGANHPLAAEYTAAGIPFIMASNVRRLVDYDGAKKLPPQVVARLRVGFAEPGDVIYTHKGTIGRVALNTQACILTPQTTYYRIRRPIRWLVPEYLRFVLMSSMHHEQVADVSEQTTRDFLPVSRQYAAFLPLPPLEEQRRISEKLKQLMNLCDTLEVRLGEAEDRAAKLVGAVVQELVA